jgi:hypothetical protein
MGKSPVIIDNTNTQTWEFKPYISMVIHLINLHSFKFSQDSFFLKECLHWRVSYIHRDYYVHIHVLRVNRRDFIFSHHWQVSAICTIYPLSLNDMYK